MYKAKRIAIVMGKVVQQNAPIKLAHIIEGLSDVDISDSEDA